MSQTSLPDPPETSPHSSSSTSTRNTSTPSHESTQIPRQISNYSRRSSRSRHRSLTSSLPSMRDSTRSTSSRSSNTTLLSTVISLSPNLSESNSREPPGNGTPFQLPNLPAHAPDLVAVKLDTLVAINSNQQETLSRILQSLQTTQTPTQPTSTLPNRPVLGSAHFYQHTYLEDDLSMSPPLLRTPVTIQTSEHPYQATYQSLPTPAAPQCTFRHKTIPATETNT